MTDERKNEIWAMLTQKEKDDFQELYKVRTTRFDIGFSIALAELFGKHNLTAQAEEEPSNCIIGTKPPSYKLNVESSQENPLDVAYDKSNGESNGESTDWNTYRLDLAKEIAVAMLRKRSDDVVIAQLSVNLANEIVKRLKETYNAD